MLRFLAAAACGFALAWSVYIHSLLRVFGWGEVEGPLAVGMCMAALMLCFGAAVPLMLAWTKAWNPRWLMAAGALLVGGSQFACAAADGVLVLLAGYGVMLGIGLGCVHAGVARMRGGGASGSAALAMGGVGVGLAIAGPMLSAVIELADFRIAFCVSGGASFLLLVGVATLMRVPGDDPSAAGQAVPGEGVSVPLALALRTGKIWVLALLLALMVFAGIMPLTWLAMLVDSEQLSPPGFDVSWGGVALGVFGLCLAMATPVWGALAPAARLGARWCLVLCPLILAAGLANLYAAYDTWHMLLSCALMGLGLCGAVVAHSKAAAERYGREHLGQISGVLCFVGIGLGGGAGAMASGLVYAKFDNFTAGFAMASVACFGAALGAAVLLMKRSTAASKPDLADEQTAGWRLWPHNWPLPAIRRWRLVAGVAGAVGLAAMLAGHHRSWKVTVDTYGVVLQEGELAVGVVGDYVSSDASSTEVGPVVMSTEDSYLPIRLEWRPFMADSETLMVPIWLAAFPAIVLCMWCHFTLLGLARGRLGKNCGKCGYDLRRTPVCDGKKQCPECGERWAA